MNTPERIQRKRSKGWRMPENTVSVTRPGKWGNPFEVGPELSAAEAVRLFEENILPGLPVHELRGKNLACFCPLGSPCHADLLLRSANAEDRPGGREGYAHEG
jgi:hypothetical protein